MDKSASIQVPGEALKIVEYCETNGGGKCNLRLNYDSLFRVLGPVATTKVIVLSVAGPFRSGKSFLLNFLLRYLHAKAIGNEEILPDQPLTGFPWSQGSERNTSGLLMWSHPFKFRLEDGSTAAVILMDTHGLFDDETPMDVAKLMVSTSVLISSIQIYNVRTILNEDDFETLQFITHTATRATDETIGLPPFQRLVFLIRDWFDPSKHYYGKDGGKGFLEQRFKTKETGSQQRKESVKSAFEELDCFLMPSPGPHAERTPDPHDPKEEAFTGKPAQLEPKFLKFLQELEEFLFFQGKPGFRVKRICNEYATGEKLLCHMQSILALFQDGFLPTPASAVQTMIDEHNRCIIGKCLEHYRSDLSKKTERKEVTSKDIEYILRQAKQTAVQHFEKHCKGNSVQVNPVKECLLNEIQKTEDVIRLAYQDIWEEHELLSKRSFAEAEYEERMDQLFALNKPYMNEERFNSTQITVHAEVVNMFTDSATGRQPCVSKQKEALESIIENKSHFYRVKNDMKNPKKLPKYKDISMVLNALAAKGEDIQGKTAKVSFSRSIFKKKM